MKAPFYRTITSKGLIPATRAIPLLTMAYVFSPCIVKRSIEHRILSIFRENALVEVNNFRMVISLKDRGIHRELFIYRKREPLSTEYLLNSRLLQEGDVVLDIGANIGYYALIESRLVGASGKVYAVEPVSTNIRFLVANKKRNRCDNIEVFRLAIGDKNGKSTIYVSDHSNLSSMVRNPRTNVIKEETVEVVTVDSFLEGRRSPKLIRMDVEGYEYNIIRGMKKTLKKPVYLLIEVHGHLMPREKSIGLLRMLRKNGFRAKFAVVDRDRSFNRIAEWTIKKSGVEHSRVLSLDMEELYKWIVEERKSAHILFTNM